jgi:hypothetical protein
MNWMHQPPGPSPRRGGRRAQASDFLSAGRGYQAVARQNPTALILAAIFAATLKAPGGLTIRPSQRSPRPRQRSPPHAGRYAQG